MDIPSRALERRKLVKYLKFCDHHWPHFYSSGECSPSWSCLHVDLHWVHYNGWHSGVLTIALSLLAFWQRHDVHVIDNSHSSDNYFCICINSWEWWLCAWIQGSCMFFFSSWCSEYFLVMIHPPQKFHRETVSQHQLWVTQCLHWQASSPPQLLAGKDRGLPLFCFLSFLFHFSLRFAMFCAGFLYIQYIAQLLHPK